MNEQIKTCGRYEVAYEPPKENEKLGIALSTIGQLPINGLRHKSENGTCGWYIWCGEKMGQENDFFKPLHVSHISEYLPQIEKYLALPVGYRFLVADDYKDVWYDDSVNT